MFITKNAGHSCVHGPCGYLWYPGTGVKGVPVAAIMDGVVAMTFATWEDLWADIQKCDIEDATHMHDVTEGSAVLYFRDRETGIAFRKWQINNVSPADEMFAALMTSSPTLIRITEENKLVMAGWTYKDGVFYEPV